MIIMSTSSSNSTSHRRHRSTPLSFILLVAAACCLLQNHVVGGRLHETTTLDHENVTQRPARRQEGYDGQEDENEEDRMPDRKLPSFKWCKLHYYHSLWWYPRVHRERESRSHAHRSIYDIYSVLLYSFRHWFFVLSFLEFLQMSIGNIINASKTAIPITPPPAVDESVYQETNYSTLPNHAVAKC